MKWVSLMLWAGASPFAPGEEDYRGEPRNSEDEGLSVLSYAALYSYFEVFRLKKVRLHPAPPVAQEVMRRIGCEEGLLLRTAAIK